MLFAQSNTVILTNQLHNYTKLIDFLSSDSARYNSDGTLSEGWKEDYYSTGKILHKGFYKNGKLLLFKNFYENGICERQLKSPDPLHHEIDLYYENGNMKEQKTYFNSVIKRISEYYANGFQKCKTDFDKEGKLIISKKSWYPNGSIESELKLMDSKTKKYTQKHYYDNGYLQEEGHLLFSLESKSYKKNGVWNVYDLTGKNKQAISFN